MPVSHGRGTAAAIALVGIAATVTVCALSPAAYAESLPAGIRACAHEPDSLKRLVCFDKEVARYSDEPAATSDGRRIPPGGQPAPVVGAHANATATAAAGAQAGAQSATLAASPGAAPAAGTQAAMQPAPFASPGANPTVAAALTQASPPASAPTPVPAAVTPAVPKHIAAKVVSVENFPDAIVVHLDNGQVWEQIQESSADANLRAGDTVSIDRELGSYWLSGKNGAALKVKQKK